MGGWADFSGEIYGKNRTFFTDQGDFTGNPGYDTPASDKIKALVDNKQLTINKDEKTFSFGTADFNEIWKTQSANIDPSGLPREAGQSGLADLYGQITQPYINTFRQLVDKGFSPDTTSVSFYNQALLTDVQLRGGTKASLVSLADPKNTYDVYKTADGWSSTDPNKPTTSSAKEKTSRSYRPGEPEVAQLGEKRRAGAQAASFLGLSAPASTPSILSGE